MVNVIIIIIIVINTKISINIIVILLRGKNTALKWLDSHFMHIYYLHKHPVEEAKGKK